MKYSPNLKDPRVLKKLVLAYGYAISTFDETTPACRSQQAIDKRFGQSQKNISKWLRSTLLICTDHYYSNASGISKKYILNAEGVTYVKSVIEDNITKAFTPTEQTQLKQKQIIEPVRYLDQFVVSKIVQAEHADELNTKIFAYTDKSNRLWHPLQNIRNKYKKEILNDHGLKYHYDIKCCAPTLILQRAQHLGMDEYMTTIKSYLDNRTECRDRITTEAELFEVNGYSEKTSKILINALFCGARLGNSREFALSKLLEHDKARIELLKEDKWLTSLRNEIKMCWNTIKDTMSRRSVIDKNGNTKLLPISSRQKWTEYFRLEREVLNAAESYFKKTNNNCFLEHDGWSTSNMIDVVELQRHIRNKTGYVIEIESEYVTE